MSRRRLHDEAGTTLVELMMAVAILGVGVVAIVAGMSTSIITSDHHRKQSEAETVLASATESIKSQATNPYTDCASTYTPVATLPTGWTASVVTVQSVQYWDGASSFTGSCPSPDRKLQLVQIRVTTPDSRAVEDVSVVKRNPA